MTFWAEPRHKFIHGTHTAVDVSVALHWEVCPEVKYMMLLAGGWGRGWNPFFVLPIDPRVNRGLPSICRPACSRGQTMMGIFIGVMRMNCFKMC